MSDCFGSFGFCCCCQTVGGPWDHYHEWWGIYDPIAGQHIIGTGSTTVGTPHVPRSAGIYDLDIEASSVADFLFPYDFYFDFNSEGIYLVDYLFPNQGGNLLYFWDESRGTFDGTFNSDPGSIAFQVDHFPERIKVWHIPFRATWEGFGIPRFAKIKSVELGKPNLQFLQPGFWCSVINVAGPCEHYLRARIVDHDGNPLTGELINIQLTDQGNIEEIFDPLSGTGPHTFNPTLEANTEAILEIEYEIVSYAPPGGGPPIQINIDGLLTDIVVEMPDGYFVSGGAFPPDTSYDDNTRGPWSVQLSPLWDSKTIASSLCPLGVSSEVVYLTVGDPGGDREQEADYTFTLSLQGFSEAGQSANIGVSWIATGNPGGALDWHHVGTANGYAEHELARTPTARTWSNLLGLPASTEILSIEVVDYQRRVAATGGVVAHRLRAFLIDQAGNQVGPNLIDNPLPLETTPDFLTEAGSGVYTFGTPPVNTDQVRLALRYDLTTDAALPPAAQVLIDNIQIRVFYRIGVHGGIVKIDAETKEHLWSVLGSEWIDAGAFNPLSLPGGPGSIVLYQPNGFAEHGQFSFAQAMIGQLYTPNVGDRGGGGSGVAEHYARQWLYNLELTGPGGGLWKQWNAGDGGSGRPFYQATTVSPPIPSQAFDLPYTLPLPIAQAAQCDKAIGSAHFAPATKPGGPQGRYLLVEHRTAQVAVGSVELTTGNMPYIDGPVIWSRTQSFVPSAEAPGSPPITSGGMYVLVNSFDASPQGHIAVLTYGEDLGELIVHVEALPPFHVEHDVTVLSGWAYRIVLIVNGVTIGDRLVLRADVIEAPGRAPNQNPDFITTYTFGSGEYCDWFNPRMIQPTEAAQGGGTKAVVFTKNLDDNYGFIRQWVLHVYDSGGGHATATSLEGYLAFFNPRVTTSSDRWMYLLDFPRLLDPGDNGSPVHLDWMVSHDLSIWNPLGVGPRDQRMDWPTFLYFFGIEFPATYWTTFDSVKHSELVPHTPPLEEL